MVVHNLELEGAIVYLWSQTVEVYYVDLLFWRHPFSDRDNLCPTNKISIQVGSY